MEAAQQWIDRLNLQPHPEGGWYRQTYRAPLMLTHSALPGHGGDRAASTAIYFLLEGDQFSAFHRLRERRSLALLRRLRPRCACHRARRALQRASSRQRRHIRRRVSGRSSRRLLVRLITPTPEYLRTRRLHRRPRLRLRRLRNGKARYAGRAIPAASRSHPAPHPRVATTKTNIILIPGRSEAKDLQFSCVRPQIQT